MELNGTTGVFGRPGSEVAALNLPDPFPRHSLPEGAYPSRVPGNYSPQMPLEERDRRRDLIRKKMLMAGVDVLIFFGNDIYWDMGLANLRYLFGTASKIGSTGLFFLDEPPILYTAVAHMSRPFNFQATIQDWTDDIRIWRGMDEIAAEIRDRGADKSRIGIVTFSSTIQTTPTLLHEDYESVHRALPEATFIDFNYALQEARMVKSEHEIDHMRRAGVIARRVLDVLVSSARPGATEAEVYANMVQAHIAAGGEPNIFNLFASGPLEHPTQELWHLLHGVDQPSVPTTRPLDRGDLIVTEWHTKYGGYLVHTEYTVYVGDRVPQGLQDIWQVSLDCLDASREAFQPGVTLREAWEAIRRPCEDAGYDFVELGFHAMGLASPEFPTVIYRPGYGARSLNGAGIGDLVLEEGMTFGNNIDIHNPRWKPDVGCMLSDFMVVRPGGAELLIGTPREIGLGGA
jgi:Xaa-Pro aminopeptidase